jgi:hypothetical protein
MQLPEFPRFANLTAEDKPLFDSLLKQTQLQISELTFTNLLVWNTSEQRALVATVNSTLGELLR